jgi:hypothetical protein
MAAVEATISDFTAFAWPMAHKVPLYDGGDDFVGRMPTQRTTIRAGE